MLLHVVYEHGEQLLIAVMGPFYHLIGRHQENSSVSLSAIIKNATKSILSWFDNKVGYTTINTIL